MYYGVLMAMACYFMIVMPNYNGDFFISIGAAVCSCFIVWREKEESWRSLCSTVLIIPYFFIFYYVSTKKNIIECLIIILFLLFTSMMIEKNVFGEMKFGVFPMLMISVYLLLQKIPIELLVKWISYAKKNIIIEFLFFIILNILFEMQVKNIFSDVVNSEKELNKGKCSKEEYNKRKHIVYFKIIIVILGILSLLFHWVGENAAMSSNFKFISMGNFSYGVFWYLSIGCCIASFITYMLSRKREKISDLAVIGIVILTYLCMFCNLFLYVKEDVILHKIVYPPQIILLIITMFATLGVPLLIGYGIKMNLNILRNKINNIVDKVSIIFIVGGAIINLLNTIILINQMSIANAVLVFMNSIIICEVLPLLCTFSLRAQYTNGQREKLNSTSSKVVPNEPYQGVMQDGFSAMVLQIFLVEFPCFYIYAFKNIDIGVWFGLIGVMISAMLVAEFFLVNNINFVENQHMVVEKKPMEESMWKILQDCLCKQNIIAIFSTLPFCICKIIILSCGIIMAGKAKNFKELKHYLISRYLKKE